MRIILHVWYPDRQPPREVVSRHKRHVVHSDSTRSHRVEDLPHGSALERVRHLQENVPVLSIFSSCLSKSMTWRRIYVQPENDATEECSAPKPCVHLL